MSGPFRTIITLLLMLLVAFPVVSWSPALAERVVYPDLRTPPGVDVAEALFTFEEILLSRGFRVTRHVYLDVPLGVPLALIMEIMETETPRNKQLARGPSYIFEFEVSPDLVGEMVLQYDSQSEMIYFEAARFEEEKPGKTYFERFTDDLLDGIIQEIEGRLK